MIVENVPAAASGSHERHWARLEDGLRRSGYNVRRAMVDGSATGLAQRRRRLFLVCWRGSEHRRVEIEGRRAVALPSALAALEGVGGHAPLQLSDPQKLRIARRIAAGQKLSDVRLGASNVASWEVPEAFGPTTTDERQLLVLVARMRRRARVRSHGDGDPVPIGDLAAAFGRDPRRELDRLVGANYLRQKEGGVELRRTYNGKFRRLHWDLLAPTVDTHFGKPGNFLHPTEHRGMTLREAMRLQGLPDWFQVLGSPEAAFRMVGNAVPPPMGAAVAGFVREALLKDCK